MSAVAAPEITLIVILYRSVGHLPSFLDCLLAQQLENWQLVVIDNASPDTSGAVIEARKDDRINVFRNSRNVGFAKAANQGLRNAFASGSTFCLLINIDTTFGPTFLKDFVRVRNLLNAAVITPRIMLADRPDEAWYAGGHFKDGWTFEAIHEGYDPNFSNAPRLVEFASGCCLGLTRSSVERAGLLDESFFVYWEDVDLSMRMSCLDIPIYYVPELSLLHAGGASSGGAFSRSHRKLYYRSYMTFLRKHFGVGRAFRVMVRLLGRELEREERNWIAFLIMAKGMLWGVATPLHPPPTLPISATTSESAR